jgi:hypothetical protein
MMDEPKWWAEWEPKQKKGKKVHRACVGGLCLMTLSHCVRRSCHCPGPCLFVGFFSGMDAWKDAWMGGQAGRLACIFFLASVFIEV